MVDATDKVLGRLATRNRSPPARQAQKAIYTPHVDTGDFIVVTNVERSLLPVTRPKTKYYRHSGYPGGVSETNFKKMQQRWAVPWKPRSGACCRSTPRLRHAGRN